MKLNASFRVCIAPSNHPFVETSFALGKMRGKNSGEDGDHAGYGEPGVEAVAPAYGDPHDVPPDSEALAPISEEHALQMQDALADAVGKDAARDLQEGAAKKVRARRPLLGAWLALGWRLVGALVGACAKTAPWRATTAGQDGQAFDGGADAPGARPAEGAAQALQDGARACRAVQARQNACAVPRVRAVPARKAAPGVPRLQRGFAALVPALQAKARLQRVQRLPAQQGETMLQGLQRLSRVLARPAAQKLP